MSQTDRAFSAHCCCCSAGPGCTLPPLGPLPPYTALGRGAAEAQVGAGGQGWHMRAAAYKQTGRDNGHWRCTYCFNCKSTPTNQDLAAYNTHVGGCRGGGSIRDVVGGRGVNTLSKCQVPNSYILRVKMFGKLIFAGWGGSRRFGQCPKLSCFFM